MEILPTGLPDLQAFPQHAVDPVSFLSIDDDGSPAGGHGLRENMPRLGARSGDKHKGEGIGSRWIGGRLYAGLRPVSVVGEKAGYDLQPLFRQPGQILRGTGAEDGDLLVIFGDDTTRCWKQIIYFNSDSEAPVTEAAPVASPIDTSFEDMFESDQNLIRDARGVRLARDISEDAD